jgi:Domain of unknown function (DUF4129)
MTKRGTIIVCAVLGAVILVAVGGEGAARFTGLRFNPNMFTSVRPPAAHNLLPSLKHSPLPLPPHGQQGSSTWLAILFWLGIVALTVVLVIIVLRWLAGRPARTARLLEDARTVSTPAEPLAELEPEPDAPTVRRGVAAALALLDGEREPRDAIVKAWLGLQETAEDAGLTRGVAETPTEFTSRMLRRGSADSAAVKTLLTLYLQVRFGDHPATSADVASARHALEALAASWDAVVSA